jgi:hypothetical protein
MRRIDSIMTPDRFAAALLRVCRPLIPANTRVFISVLR